MNQQNKLMEANDVILGANRLLIMSGAGISAESGVPTFRGNGDKWKGIPFHELSSAKMVEENLPLVWEWFDYRRGVVSKCEPNPAHIAIAAAQISGKFEDLSLITQNIDGLHRKANALVARDTRLTPPMIELHGHIHEARCLSCSSLQMLKTIPEDERPPICSRCFDSMRPHVILFGEGLNDDDLLAAYEKAAKCDVCIVVGTSALVYPAMHIPMIAKREGAFLIEVNLEETPFSSSANLSLFGRSGEIIPSII